MEHDLCGLRATLLSNELYGASAEFVASVVWGNARSGHVLLEKSPADQSRTNAVVSVVGRVVEDRLNCGPEGNYVNKDFGKLETAKYQLRLAKPTDTPFAPDFDKVAENLKIIRTQRAATQDRRNLIVEDEVELLLRFADNVFEKRVRNEMMACNCWLNVQCRLLRLNRARHMLRRELILQRKVGAIECCQFLDCEHQCI